MDLLAGSRLWITVQQGLSCGSCLTGTQARKENQKLNLGYLLGCFVLKSIFSELN